MVCAPAGEREVFRAMRVSWHWLACLLVCSLLLAGCGSVRTASTTSKAATPKPKRVTTSRVANEPGDAGAEKRAKAHAHFAAGVIYEMNQQAEAALEEYYQAATNDPTNEGLILDVSQRFLQKKQPEKALELLAPAAAQPGASGAIYARLALVYSQLGKMDQAVTTDRIAIKRAPELFGPYQNLFLNYLQASRPQEALKVLDDAGQQPHPGAEFLVGLAELYQTYLLQYPSQKEKINPRALAVLNRAEQLNPRHPMLQLKIADGLNQAGASGKAADIYLDLLKKLPDVPFVREQLHAKLATIYLRDADRKHALEQLEALVRDDPANAQAYYWLGSLSYDEKKPAEAAEYFHKTIMLSPDQFPEAYYYLALAQMALKKGNEAIETLAQARKKFPSNFALEFYTGLAHSEQKQFKEALPHYVEAEVLAKGSNPKLLDQHFYFEYGAASERTGDYGQAEKCFQECLRIAPDFHEAQNYLGYMWAERGVHLERARELIEKAVAAQPTNGAYLDSLGWVLFKLDQPQKALEYVLKAIDFSPDPDPSLFDHLGDIYASLRKPREAREAWAKSLALEPNPAVKKKLEPQEAATGTGSEPGSEPPK